MKFACTQENLSRGVSVVGHIATKNTSLPILNNILLKTEGGVIWLSATNLEIGITTRIRGKIEQEGACTVPGKVFSEYISFLDDSTLTLEQDGTNLHIQSEKGNTKLRSLPVEDFPLIPKIDRQKGYSCSARELREGLAQVIFAAAFDDTRPEISGVLLRFAEKELILVATDSYRLAERHLKLSASRTESTSVIVPVRALQELLRVLGQETEQVSMYLAENQILFATDETELVSRLIDGQYPNYEQIIPVNHETQAFVETTDLIKAVRASSLFSRPGINDLTFTLDPEKQKIYLQAANNQIGENEQEVDAKIEGGKSTIVFNSRYLLDGLTNLRTETTNFQMTNNASPGVFRPSKSEGYLYIIMPIKQ